MGASSTPPSVWISPSDEWRHDGGCNHRANIAFCWAALSEVERAFAEKFTGQRVDQAGNPITDAEGRPIVQALIVGGEDWTEDRRAVFLCRLSGQLCRYVTLWPREGIHSTICRSQSARGGVTVQLIALPDDPPEATR